MNLLEKLKAGTRNVRIIKFPGTDQDVAVRVLSNAEKQEALFATEDLFKKREITVSAITVEAYEDENTTQILARALRDSQDPDNPFAADADQLRGLITTDEKDMLVEAYHAFEKEVSPAPEEMTEAQMDKLIDEVKKNPAALNSLNIFLLRKLIIYSANRPQS